MCSINSVAIVFSCLSTQWSLRGFKGRALGVCGHLQVASSVMRISVWCFLICFVIKPGIGRMTVEDVSLIGRRKKVSEHFHR